MTFVAEEAGPQQPRRLHYWQTASVWEKPPTWLLNLLVDVATVD